MSILDHYDNETVKNKGNMMVVWGMIRVAVKWKLFQDTNVIHFISDISKNTFTNFLMFMLRFTSNHYMNQVDSKQHWLHLNKNSVE